MANRAPSRQASTGSCCPDKGMALKVSSVIFGMVALLHAWRIFTQTPAVFGSTIIPMWASAVAFLAAGALSWWTCKAGEFGNTKSKRKH